MYKILRGQNRIALIMSGNQEGETPYGAWSTPITAEMVASGGIGFGHTDLDGDTVYQKVGENAPPSRKPREPLSRSG